MDSFILSVLPFIYMYVLCDPHSLPLYNHWPIPYHLIDPKEKDPCITGCFVLSFLSQMYS